MKSSKSKKEKPSIAKRTLPPLRIGFAAVAFSPSFYGFQDAEYKERAFFLQQKVNRLNCEWVACDSAFQTAEDATRCAEFLTAQKADVVVLDVATFPEGKAWMAFVSRLAMPVILWARPEAHKDGPVGHNSFCGANFILANLRRDGRRARVWFGDLKDKAAETRMRETFEILAAAKAARGSRIGLVGGGIVPKFFDLDLSETERTRLETAWDIGFETISLDDVTARMAALAGSKVEPEATRQQSLYTACRVPASAVETQARLCLALRELCEEKNLAALAIRCWPEFQSTAQFWPCGAIGHLCDAGIPTACEGDPGGAVDMLLAQRLSSAPSTLLDIIDFDDAKDTVSLWHCGPTAPSHAADGKISLLPHAVDGADEHGRPRAGHPAIHDLNLRSGRVTVLRTLGALDDEFRFDAEILPPNGSRITGSFAKATRLHSGGTTLSVAEARRRIFAEGIPHHYTVFYRED